MDIIEELLAQPASPQDWPVHSTPALPPQLQCIPKPMESHVDPPVKVRKKPGRKPNPASPALRKAQNRAAQRAFRERKERHLRDLETTIRTLREQRQQTVKELNATKSKLDSFRAENWYLKGLVLTLQFVCLHHNIQVPTHSPYLTEEALSDIAQSSPHAIEAYVNAYMRNNVNLKPTMASHLANSFHHEEEEEEEEEERMEQHHPSPPEDDQMDEDSDVSYVKQEAREDEMFDQWLHKEETPPKPATTSLSAIQKIRLQLRIQSALSSFGESAARLQPTLLQLSISHDPRIDLIPTPHMRDRMIIFRDQMDYDRCFSMLLNGAVYHGGDPTMSESWELPAEFFSEFWFLTIDYDRRKTNKWRRLKGLPEIGPSPDERTQSRPQQRPPPSQQQQQQHGSDHLWSDEALAQFVDSMPTLQPLDRPVENSYLMSPPSDFDDKVVHPIFSQIMGSNPETRQPARAPSLGAIMELMSQMTTESQQP
ncbi:hypothetical protein BJV82DRAFT_544392 [Fennellomyces sp. T-0311]|nr:hypothetical protein BJV82DRAFT_544392 [Fennellomyces sp. T-0311]